MTFIGSITSGSPVVTGISDTTGLLADMYIEGTGISTDTRIASIDSSSQITLNKNVTATNGSASLTAYSFLSGQAGVIASIAGDIGNTSVLLSAQTYVIASLSGEVQSTSSALIGQANIIASLSGDAQIHANSLSGQAEVEASLAGNSTLLSGLNGEAEVEASLTGAISDASIELSGEAILSTSVDGQISEVFLNISGTANVEANASGQIDRLIQLTGQAIVAGISAGVLRNDVVFHGETTVAGKVEAYLSFVGQGLGVCDILNDIFLLWGIEDARLSVEYLRERALNDLNAAMQIIWLQAKDRDYFSRRTLTVGVDGGSSHVELDQEVQNVIGPIRRESDRVTLRPLSSRSQLDLFGHLFLGQLGSIVARGLPQAFFAERLNQNRPDNTKIILHVVPVPDDAINLLVDVAMECPRYEWKDYCQCTPLHIPHRYVESILLPVCRHLAMSSHYFVKEDRRELIENEYAMAMQLLGLADPQLKEVEAERRKERATK